MTEKKPQTEHQTAPHPSSAMPDTPSGFDAEWVEELGNFMGMGSKTKTSNAADETKPSGASDPAGEGKAGGEINEAGAADGAAVVELQVQLKKAQEQADEFKDKFLRTCADMENLKRRSEKELQDTRKYAVSGLVKDLVGVAEALYQATEQITDEQKQSELVQKIVEGIELTRKELMGVLSKNAVKRVAPEPGELFDHNYHQAISQVPDAQFPKNTVIKVIQAGYAIADRLIKPSLVVVSAGPAAAAGGE